jgi:nicotinamide-nucleotide amidase
VAGPTEFEGQPVGTLYLGLATPAGTTARLFNLPPVARQDLKERAAYLAIYYLYQQAKAR